MQTQAELSQEEKAIEAYLAKKSSGWLLAEYDRIMAARKWAADPLLFAHDLFPHHFTRSKAIFHDELVAKVFPQTPLETGLKLAIAAPRGFAKSTICSLLFPIWSVCLRKRHFIIICSNTHSQAVKFLQAIKYEFETNDALKKAFPNLKPRKEKWSEQELELTWGKQRFKLLAQGAEAQLRGLKFLQHRPDLIIIDDGEDDEMVESELRRETYQHWLNHVVLQTNPRAWVIKIGTVLHEAALLNKIVRQPDAVNRRMYADWTTALYTALLDEGTSSERSSWEEHQSTADLQAERERDPYGFAQEKQNSPVPAGYCMFKPEYFRDDIYYTDAELPQSLRISITIDPACTDNEQSDETVITTAGWDPYGRLWLLNEVAMRYANPSDVLDSLFSEYRRWVMACKNHQGWEFYSVGIESVAFQKWLKHLFEQRAAQERMRPFITELPVDAKKTRRIQRLEPLFRNRTIRLLPDLVELERQLKAFPNGEHDDRADALAHHIHFAPKQPAALPEATPSIQSAFRGLTFAKYAKLSEEHKRLRQFNPYHPPLMSLN